jgi:hypothetical protein
MILLADEGVDKPIVDQLRSSGFDVHYILETDPGSLDEERQSDSALHWAERRCKIF